MSQELKKKYDFYQDEFDKETRHEMEEWARLVDKYAHELKKFDLVCAFCGQHMSDISVNADCLENNSMFDSYTFFTEDEPQQHFIHKGRHWFGRPSLRQEQPNNTDYRADSFIQEHPQQAALVKKITSLLSNQHLATLQRQVKSKDDLVNQLFTILDPMKIKPAEILQYVNLFNDQNFRDAIMIF